MNLKSRISLYSIIIIIFLLALPVFSEDQPDIGDMLNKVAMGKVAEVKARLPDLLVDNPNDPGVQLLLAVCIEDAYKAMDIYTKIVKKYPESEWADDAYWRIIQFYAILGDTTRAREELDNFSSQYPTSQFLIPAYDVVRSSVGISRLGKSMIKKEYSPKESKSSRKVKKEEQENNDELEREKTQVSIKKIETKPSKRTEDMENLVKAAMDEKKEEEKKAVEKEVPKEIVKPKVIEKAPEEIKSKEVEPEQSTKSTESKHEEMAEKPKMIDERSMEEPVKSNTYGLQVGIYSSKEAADNEMRKYLRQRMRTEVKPKKTSVGEMYAVVIGNYSSKQSAEAAKIVVSQQCNCDPTIFEK